MTKKERLEKIKIEYQDRLNHMGDNNLIDGNVAFGLAYLIVIATNELKAADGRRKSYREYERLTVETLEKAFNDVEKEVRK